jgi:urocanate hydratase
LKQLTEDQTLVVQSGHPLGSVPIQPEHPPGPIITNGLMVGLYDNPDDWEIAAQMGVSSYGQMTAGGWMYIGPQGIVHGTYNTLLGAGRKMCGVPADGNLAGLLFVSSGLGGMSGAQPKAAEIAGAVSVIAEVDRSRIETRHRQGWVNMVSDDLVRYFYKPGPEARRGKQPLSIAYHGNVVDLLAYAWLTTRS